MDAAFSRQALLVADDFDPPRTNPADLAERVKDPADLAALADPAALAEHLDPRYVRRPHTDVIGAELAQLELSWRNGQVRHSLDRASGEYDRLAINLPPQVGKTFTTVEWGAFWWLILHPTHHVVIGSYGDSLAVKRGRAIRRLVVVYGVRFGLRLEKGTAAAKDWALTLGGSVRSVGVGSGITGNPADIIFVDDPIKSRAEAESPDRREKIHDWYSADILSRQSPGTPVVLLMTPWHPDDLRARVIDREGRIEDGGRWRLCVMPAICTDPTRDPLHRTPGDPLPHPKLPTDRRVLLAHWDKVKGEQTPRDWAALWQCDPRPVFGALLTYKILRERRCFELANIDAGRGPCADQKTIAVAIDPSGGGRSTAGIVGGYKGIDGRCYFTHDRTGHMPSDEWARAACELAAEIGADRFIIERNFGGDMASLILRTAWTRLRAEDPNRYSVFIPRVVEVTARRGKLLRAEPIAQQVIEDRCRLASLMPDFEQEWATWRPGTDSPGRIDASVHMAYNLLDVPGQAPADVSAVATFAAAGSLQAPRPVGNVFGGGWRR